MSKRRLKSAKSKERAIVVNLEDRLATDIPTHAHIAIVDVEDPYDRGVFIAALANMRGDHLRRLHAKRRIDDAQYQAGRRWQQLYEEAEVGAIKAMDTTKEPVDGGGFAPELLTDRRKKAIALLTECCARDVLGKEGDALMRRFLAHNDGIETIAELYGQPEATNYIFQQVKNSLENLAKHFGYA